MDININIAEQNPELKGLARFMIKMPLLGFKKNNVLRYGREFVVICDLQDISKVYFIKK